MGKADKLHRKKVKLRNEKMKKGHWELEMLKKKIYEEAKQRYLEEQNKPVEIKTQIK
jgi:hypothetical protein